MVNLVHFFIFFFFLILPCLLFFYKCSVNSECKRDQRKDFLEGASYFNSIHVHFGPKKDGNVKVVCDKTTCNKSVSDRLGSFVHPAVTKHLL